MNETIKYLDARRVDYVVSADGRIVIQDDLRIEGVVILDGVERITGSVDVRQGATFTAPALTKSGSVDVRQGATFTAPALTKSGSVDVRQGATFTAPALTEVSGYVYVQGSVYVRQGATFTAPALTEVSGYVYVQQGATFTGPALTEVSGYVDVRQGATFTAPALTEVSGYVYVQQGATFTAPALTKSGYVYVRQGATLIAPALTEVSGYVDVQQGATLTAPALTEVSGYVDVQQGATLTAPALTEVSGYVYVRQGATFTAPALTEVSGYVDVQQRATFTAPALKEVDEVRFNGEFLGKTITVIDEIGCVVISEKTSDGVVIRYCQKSRFVKGKLAGDKFYVASNATHNAHGASIREAIEELAFKSGIRNVEQYRNMPLDTVKSPQEWAFIYRMVTGACRYGATSFMESKGKLKKKYRLSEIIEQTKGAYGNEQFRSVVAGKVAA